MYLAGILGVCALLSISSAAGALSQAPAEAPPTQRQSVSSQTSANPNPQNESTASPKESESVEPSQTPQEKTSEEQPVASQGGQTQEGSSGKQQAGTPPASSTSSIPSDKSKQSSASASKTHHRKHRRSRRNKIIVREGGTTEASALLAPGMPGAQASHQRQNATQLLASTDGNLKRISGRQLNSNQQAMVDQIHSFMQQAKDAIKEGDLQRGHNLAMKAHLLSDELLKH